LISELVNLKKTLYCKPGILVGLHARTPHSFRKMRW